MSNSNAIPTQQAQTQAQTQTPLNLLKDKEWRLNHLYKIIDKEGNLSTFKFNEAQAYFHKHRHTRNVIPKARQLGITTYKAIYMLDDVLFNPNFKAVLIAHDYKSMTEIFEKVQIAWEQFPKDIKNYVGWEERTDNKNQLKFNNYSSFTVALSTRSGTVNHLHISEFGKICKEYPDKAKEILRGSIPSVVPNGIVDIESTVEESGGYFREFYDNAFTNASNTTTSKDFKRFFFPWTMEKKYQIPDDQTQYIHKELPQEFLTYQIQHNLTNNQICWYYKTMTNDHLDWDGMKKEYPTTADEAFESSNATYFDKQLILHRIQNDVQPPIRIFSDWKIFDTYNPKHRYAIGADPAEGVGRDHAAAVIIDFANRLPNYQIVPKVVATYKSNITDPIEFAFSLADTGRMYGSCIIAPERNNHGHTVIGKLKEIYGTIYKQVVKDRIDDKEVDRYGWLTTAATKPTLLSELRSAVHNNELIIPDSDLLNELLNYGDEDYKRIKNDPTVTNHFDMVMALAIAWEMRHYAIDSFHSEPEVVTETFTDPHAMFQI